MRVLMLGWEFPPHISGGLGTACYGLSKSLSAKGQRITFVLPRLKGDSRGMDSHLDLRQASGQPIEEPMVNAIRQAGREMREEQMVFRRIDSLLMPYDTIESYYERRQMTRSYRLDPVNAGYDVGQAYVEMDGDYGPDLLSEVRRYTVAAASLALTEDFDLIHAHDWMTYPAAMLIRKLTGKPWAAHLHSTEYDRSGENINQPVADLEQAGLQTADLVIAVSHRTMNIAVNRYGVSPDKITVVHNAVSRHEMGSYKVPEICRQEKRVLFLGRVTFQKGPDYFVEAARLVLQKLPNVRFVMAGTGDMLSSIVRRVGQLRMGSRFHFTGFMRGEDVDRIYAISDLYVMPSVSEPFGIAPLEALLYDVPVLLSRQSGVSEILRNALKVDFWDIREMANKICAVLSYPSLASEMIKNCREELKSITWDSAADGVVAAYTRLTQGG